MKIRFSGLVILLLLVAAGPSAPARSEPQAEAVQRFWRDFGAPVAGPDSAPEDPVETAYRIVHSLQGRPDGPWPRALPVIDAPPIRGLLYSPTTAVQNYGSETFVGDRVFTIPELGYEKRTRVTLEKGLLRNPADWQLGSLRLAPPVWWDWTGLHVTIPVDAPDQISIHYWFESNGVAVGERYDRVLQVEANDYCMDHARFAFSGGQKRIRFPWDSSAYGIVFCNRTETPHWATVVVRDENTQRPWVEPACVGETLRVAKEMVRRALGQPYDGNFAVSLCAVLIPPHSFVLAFSPPDLDYFGVSSPPVDARPRFTLLWDDGLLEYVDGDPTTFLVDGDSKALLVS